MVLVYYLVKKGRPGGKTNQKSFIYHQYMVDGIRSGEKFELKKDKGAGERARKFDCCGDRKIQDSR